MHTGLEKLNIHIEPQYDPLQIAVELAIANEALNDAYSQCDELTRLTENVKEITRVANVYGQEATDVLNDLFDMHAIESSTEGIWEGIKKFFAAIWNAIKKFFQWIWNGIKRLFGGGNKIPGTEHANELAQAVPELAPLIDQNATAGAHVSLDNLVNGLEVMITKGTPWSKGDEVTCCDTAKIKVVVDGLVAVFDKTVENVKTIANKYVGSISDSVSSGTNQTNSQPVQGNGFTMSSPTQAATAGIEAGQKQLVTDLNTAVAAIKDDKIVQAIITGKTEGLSEYITENYALKVSDPKVLLTNIRETKQLTDQTQKYTNDISTGLSSVEKELVEKLATKDGQIDNAKKGAINSLVMTGFQQLRRILGIFQGMYNFFVQTETTLSGSTDTILEWFKVKTAKQEEANEKRKQTRAENKAKKDAEKAAEAEKQNTQAAPAKAEEPAAETTPEATAASKRSAAAKQGWQTRKQKAAQKSEK